MGSGVTVSNAVFTGANIVAGGTFSGGGTGAGSIIGFEIQGVVLSTGAIASVPVAEDPPADDATTNNGQVGEKTAI